MNWFERYGIVGMFFIAMTGVWSFCLFPDFYISLVHNNGEMLVKYIAGFCGFAFLPIGYLIVILGQVLYYRTCLWEKIHCKYWEKLPDGVKKKIEGMEGTVLSKDDQRDEAKMEAILTYYDRFHIKNYEKNKFLSIFASKRYDVIAINRGLFLTIPISLISAFSLRLLSLNISLKKLLSFFEYIRFSFIIVIAGTIIIWVILRCSSGILEHQIIEIGKRKLKDIGN